MEFIKNIYREGRPRFLVTGGSGFIGTHLIKRLCERDAEVINLDTAVPLEFNQKHLWQRCDILNLSQLNSSFAEYRPTHVIHLAARASLKGDKLRDFPENIRGTRNIIRAVNDGQSIVHLVHFSTQYVLRPGIFPKADDFYRPYTAYGESKAIAEKIVRARCLRPWTIVRPTNVWGPHHPAFPHELWKFLERRLYVHPGKDPVRKAYVYVDNAICQTLAIIDSPLQLKESRTFYLNDAPINNYEWMNSFSIALSGKPVRVIPRLLWKTLAQCGDLLRSFGLNTPISSQRFFRLTTSETIPWDEIQKIAGPSMTSFREGVEASVRWYKAEFEQHIGP